MGFSVKGKEMNSRTGRWLINAWIACCMVLLTGCGGAKVLKEPVPINATQALASNSDETLSAKLDWVIFRDGPGTWAKNADWDEYLVSVENVGSDPLQITSVSLIDSLGTRIEQRLTRKELVKSAKETKRRYQDQGLEVRAGVSGKVLVGTGVVAAAGSSGLGAAAMAGGGAAAGAAAVVVLVPALTVGGVVRGINNNKVNDEIESRQTLLPVGLERGERKKLVLFYPLSPSPRRIEIGYLLGGSEYRLEVETEVALDGLHLSRR